MTDREKLMDLLCEALEDGCVGHCNYPYCHRVSSTADHLLANGVTVQQWIPVTERLPEPYVRVLALRQKFDDGGRFQKVEHIIPVYGGEFAWFMDMSSWKSKVTHWMPLPEPPKDGE